MAIRAMVLGTGLGGQGGSLGAALREALPAVETVSLPASGAGRGRALLQLVRSRPHLLVAEAFDPGALAAALYRGMVPRSRLLLCVAELPRPFGRVERWALGRADGIIAEREEVVRAVERLQFPRPVLSPLRVPADLHVFSSCPRQRFQPEAHRLLHLGPLSPESGAADLLIALAAWAEDHPQRAAEIWWAEDGDLAGVLEAQPLPPNLQQRFLQNLDRAGLADACGQCGIAVLPAAAGDEAAGVVEVLAAGMILIGSRRSSLVRSALRAGAPGWMFDPLMPADLAAALACVLGTDVDELNRLREAGRAVVSESARGGLLERLQAAAAAMLPPVRIATDAAPS